MKFGKYAICIVALGFVFSSCNKEEETLAIIHVYDVAGNIVEGATVSLWAEPGQPDDVAQGLRAGDNIAETNSRGKVTFNFTGLYEPGTSGFAVLNMQAIYLAPNDTNINDTIKYMGDGVIKIVEEQENFGEMTIFPQ